MLSSPRRPACAPVCAWRDPARCGAALAALHSCRRAAWHLRNLHPVTRRPRTAGNVLIGRRPLGRLTTRPAREFCRPWPCQWPRAMKPVLEVILDQPPAPTACVRDDDCLRRRSIRERRRQGSYAALSRVIYGHRNECHDFRAMGGSRQPVLARAGQAPSEASELMREASATGLDRLPVLIACVASDDCLPNGPALGNHDRSLWLP
jgi:hypothetical protein